MFAQSPLAAASELMGAALPPNFLYGTAVAGFQIDMGCPHLPLGSCEDVHSDWYEFITSPWTVGDPLLFMSHQPPQVGPGFFETYGEDLERARSGLASNAVRLSIEWSRIFPRPTFGQQGYDQLHALASPAGLAFYHKIFGRMRALGLTPLVTINHYSLPTWLHDGVGCHVDFAGCTRRGWDDPATLLPEITKYAGFIAREFGREVDYWATLNEPFSAVILPGYLLPSPARSNPPGVHLQAAAAKRAMATMIAAHARIYDAIHAEDVWATAPGKEPAVVGLVHSFIGVTPHSADAADQLAAKHMTYFLNDMFMDAVALGQFDQDWDGQQVLRPDLAQRMDYIGVNYYATVSAESLGFQLLPWVSPLVDFNPLAQQNLNHPRGLYDVLKTVAARYHLPMIVTETGIDTASDPSLSVGWLRGTLSALAQAISEGHDVRGYFYWSLMDNYEWNHGMDQRFGLYAVDGADPDKVRVARPAVALFQQVGSQWRFPAAAP